MNLYEVYNHTNVQAADEFNTVEWKYHYYIHEYITEMGQGSSQKLKIEIKMKFFFSTI